MSGTKCNQHPKAPHGFLRNASHNADRYVCECESWDAYEAGYASAKEKAIFLRDEVPLTGSPSEEYEDGFWDGLQAYENAIRAMK